MADARKRSASAEADAPAAKKARQQQLPTPHDSDAASDTPLTPFAVDPNRSRVKCYHCTYPNCAKAFNRPCRLEEHLRSHTGERPFACTFAGCTKAFNRQTHLNRHIKDEHDQQRDHACTWPGCAKKFGTATRLRRHQEAHENKFHCTDYPPCNETFRKHSTLQKHVLSAHLGRRPYQCTHVDDVTGKQCAQAYETASSLRAHEGRVHGGARYFCTQCAPPPDAEPADGQTPTTLAEAPGFATYALLQAHIKAVHPPTCAHCGLTCSTHKQLQAHIDLAHSGVPLEARRKYVCPHADCSQGFTKQGNLNVHIQAAHNGVRRFVCGNFDPASSTKDYIRAWTGAGACGRGFATKGNLEEHIRTQHLGLEGTRKAKLKAKSQQQDGAAATATTTRPRRTRKDGPVSVTTRLTGAGYAEETGRAIACIFADCAHRFHRDFDLEFHLGAAHGLSTREVAEAMTERAAFEGGRFWIGGAEEVDAEGEWDWEGQGQGHWGMAEEDEDAWAQAELDRRAGIVDAGPGVEIGSGELSAVWDYVQYMPDA